MLSQVATPAEKAPISSVRHVPNEREWDDVVQFDRIRDVEFDPTVVAPSILPLRERLVLTADSNVGDSHLSGGSTLPARAERRVRVYQLFCHMLQYQFSAFGTGKPQSHKMVPDDWPESTSGPHFKRRSGEQSKDHSAGVPQVAFGILQRSGRVRKAARPMSVQNIDS